MTTDGRFMACSGGWDWAPYCDTTDGEGGPNTFSKGIWKSVFIASGLSLQHVTESARACSY